MTPTSRNAFFALPLALASAACTNDVFTQSADSGEPIDAAGTDVREDSRLGDAKDASALDASDGCTPFPPGSFFDCTQPVRHINVPYEYCSQYYGARPVPFECRCMETYNCACIAALYEPDAGACGPTGYTPKCSSDGGAIYVDCIP